VSNDYFALVKIFTDIHTNFKTCVPENSVFAKLMCDLPKLNPETHPLCNVLPAWRETFANSTTFMMTLCEQFITEGKTNCIPTFIKLTKYGLYFVEPMKAWTTACMNAPNHFNPKPFAEIAEDSYLSAAENAEACFNKGLEECKAGVSNAW
jgi:hypothetical protein